MRARAFPVSVFRTAGFSPRGFSPLRMSRRAVDPAFENGKYSSPHFAPRRHKEKKKHGDDENIAVTAFPSAVYSAFYVVASWHTAQYSPGLVSSWFLRYTRWTWSSTSEQGLREARSVLWAQQDRASRRFPRPIADSRSLRCCAEHNQKRFDRNWMTPPV